MTILRPRFIFIFTLLAMISCSKITPVTGNSTSKIESQVVKHSEHQEGEQVLQEQETNEEKTHDTQSAASASLEINLKINKDKLNELLNLNIEYLPVSQTDRISKFCKKTDQFFNRYGWKKSNCESYKWIHVRDSVLGDPLTWIVFGDEELMKEKNLNVTMVICAQHGDEITPVKFCYDIMDYLYRLSKTSEGEERFKENLVVVVPIANPDSFFKNKPTRTNARGVDVNRNFPTKDWDELALKLWASHYKKDKRRFPGKASMSEPETLFQVNLIKRYNPDKIISVHSPLTILDYDGPTLAHEHLHEMATNANNLVDQMSKMAKGYTIKNYPFFPGSIGNYAGNERNIPTITLELPTSDSRKHKEYWDQFKHSIDYAIFNTSLKKTQYVSNQPEEIVRSKNN